MKSDTMEIPQGELILISSVVISVILLFIIIPKLIKSNRND